MRRIILAVFTLTTSFSIHASNITPTSDDLSSALNKSIENQSAHNRQSSIVYGGKDISRSIVASAREFTWTNQQDFIG